MENPVKPPDKVRRTEWLHIRLTPDEMKQINADQQRTSSRELSTFARKRLLEAPLTYFNRNASLDEGLLELVRLRKELNAVGNNLNQLTKKLNSFTATPGLMAVREALQLIREELDGKMEEIRDRMNELGVKWLQGSTVEKVLKGH
ncbi:plasmid mobilization relaxosome protein MobC [Mucilaginibacter litoreus]|uniref:Plasmid mobilization relaxosome protein MobC n=1 Tax=Mucilaginibacter litoreus TaxID=1048221 RepID=A0ABW3AM50_9SPHI